MTGWIILAAAVAVGAWCVRGWRRAGRTLQRLCDLEVRQAALRIPCPWCDVRECTDSTLCRCPQPCGKSYCKARTSESLKAEGAAQ